MRRRLGARPANVHRPATEAAGGGPSPAADAAPGVPHASTFEELVRPPPAQAEGHFRAPLAYLI